MDDLQELNPALKNALGAEGIDVALSLSLLERVNTEALSSQSFSPVSTHKDIVSLRGGISISRKQRLALTTRFPALQNLSNLQSDISCLSEADLEEIGTLLLPYYSCGILNGGSASSYADRTKNHSYSPHLFALYEDYFERHASHLRNKPKALVPALYTKTGAAPSFLAFKFRMLKAAYERYETVSQQLKLAPLAHAAPLFQMLSTKNSALIRNAQQDILHSEFCSSALWRAEIMDAEQSLIATISHSEAGYPRKIFDHAFGEPGKVYGLPGGHGQNFHVLRKIYTSLYEKGIRFVSIGNIDNLGYTLDMKTLAFLAISDCAALYEFSPRTQLDKKGGILITDESGALSCADLGVAIDPGDVSDSDEIFFNCANGWFSLEHLVQQLDTIIVRLPIRVSDQKKDAGMYSQIELVTWEAMPYTQPLKVLRVEKKDRLLSAKLLLESFILSGIAIERAAEIFPFAASLHTACEEILQKYYACTFADWH